MYLYTHMYLYTCTDVNEKYFLQPTLTIYIYIDDLRRKSSDSCHVCPDFHVLILEAIVDFIACLDGHSAVRQLGTEAAYWVPWSWSSWEIHGDFTVNTGDFQGISWDLVGFHGIWLDFMGFVTNKYSKSDFIMGFHGESMEV